MPARRNFGTYRDSQAAAAKVMAARDELEAQTEPMRRWPHPIPMAEDVCPGRCPCSSAGEEETSTAMTQLLEKLQYQNQVLTDLLSAVNALVAAVLCLKAPAASKAKSKPKTEESAD